MKTVLSFFLLGLTQIIAAQLIEAKAKTLSMYVVFTGQETEFLGSSDSENRYVFNLNEKMAFENPGPDSNPIQILRFQQLENGNYQIYLENKNDRKDIELLIDLIEKKLHFWVENDDKNMIKLEYTLADLTLTP